MKIFSLKYNKQAFNCRLLAALLVSALSFLFVSLEQSQAQLFIHVYPSQDNPTKQTIWIFSVSSTAKTSPTIRLFLNSLPADRFGDDGQDS